jgi:hypothetical protein
MSDTIDLSQRLHDGWRPAGLVGVAALVVCLLCAIFWPAQFTRAYLFGYLFWLGISLGSMALVMVIHLTGGEWGYPIRRLAEAAGALLPLMILLFIPIAVGMGTIYPWVHAAGTEHAAQLRALHPYLNVPFFLLRSFGYLILWAIMGWLLYAWSIRRDATADKHLTVRLHNFSAIGIVIYFFSMTFASVDWIMSREAPWRSTIFGFVVTVGQCLSALALLMLFLALIVRLKPFAGKVLRGHFNDLGSLMLTLVILWAYMNFAQYLIIWAGNMNPEIPWYVVRSHGGWAWVSGLLILFHFFAPFCILLIRGAKRRVEVMGLLAAVLLAMHVLDELWLVAPDGLPGRPGVQLVWMDFLAPIAVGGIWFAAYFWLLSRRPLLAERAPGQVPALPGRYHGEHQAPEAIL